MTIHNSKPLRVNNIESYLTVCALSMRRQGHDQGTLMMLKECLALTSSWTVFCCRSWLERCWLSTLRLDTQHKTSSPTPGSRYLIALFVSVFACLCAHTQRLSPSVIYTLRFLCVENHCTTSPHCMFVCAVCRTTQSWRTTWRWRSQVNWRRTLTLSPSTTTPRLGCQSLW